MLEQLEQFGILTLPAKSTAMVRGSCEPIVLTTASDPQPAFAKHLNQLTPLSLQLTTGKEAATAWNEYVDCYHELGFSYPMGRHIRYFILDRQGRKLGCLLFC